MQLNRDKNIYSAVTKNKNNINVVNNIVRNRDPIPSKLTHDISNLHKFTFLCFNRLA